MATSGPKWWPKPGSVVSERYSVTEEFLRGPHGILLRVTSIEDESEKILKVFHPDLLEGSEENRNRLTARLRPTEGGRIGFEESIELDTTIGLIRSCIPGPSLRELIRMRSSGEDLFPALDVGRLVTQIAAVLMEDEQVTMHGNLKPENIFIDEGSVSITDPHHLAGVSRLEWAHDYAPYWDSYPAPELYTKHGIEDPRVDVFSLAIIMGECFAGRTVRGGVPLSAQTTRFVPDELDSFFVRATHGDPEKRPDFTKFVRQVGTLLVRVSEDEHGAVREENITLVSGLPTVDEDMIADYAAGLTMEEVIRRRDERADNQEQEAEEESEPAADSAVIEDALWLGDGEKALILDTGLSVSVPQEVWSVAIETSLAEANLILKRTQTLPEFPAVNPETKPSFDAMEEALTPLAEDSADDSDEDDALATDEATDPTLVAAILSSTQEEDLYHPDLDFQVEELPVDATPVVGELEADVVAEADEFMANFEAEGDLLVDDLTDEHPILEEKQLDDDDELAMEPTPPALAEEVATRVHSQPISQSHELRGESIESEEHSAWQTGKERMLEDTAPDIQVLVTHKLSKASSGPPPLPTARLKGGSKKAAVKPARKAWKFYGMVAGLGLILGLVLVSVRSMDKGSDGDTGEQGANDSNAADVQTTEDIGGTPEPTAVVAAIADTGSNAEIPVAQPVATPTVSDAGSSKTAAVIDAGAPPVPEPTPTVVVPSKTPPPTPDVVSSDSVEEEKSCFEGFVPVAATEEVPAFCMQAYEFPGKGAKPKRRISFRQASDLCVEEGARLCSYDEYQSACGNKYPYGPRFIRSRCNVMGDFYDEQPVRRTGRKKRCVSPSGVYDLSGNVAEWVQDGRVLGGSSRQDGNKVACTYARKVRLTTRSSTIGFRCCMEIGAQ